MKSFGTCLPARTAQADMSRYFAQMHRAPFFTEHGSFDYGSNASIRSNLSDNRLNDEVDRSLEMQTIGQ